MGVLNRSEKECAYGEVNHNVIARVRAVHSKSSFQIIVEKKKKLNFRTVLHFVAHNNNNLM